MLPLCHSPPRWFSLCHGNNLSFWAFCIPPPQDGGRPLLQFSIQLFSPLAVFTRTYRRKKGSKGENYSYGKLTSFFLQIFISNLMQDNVSPNWVTHLVISFHMQLSTISTERNIKFNFMCAAALDTEGLHLGSVNISGHSSLQVSTVIIGISPPVNVHIMHVHDTG